MTIFAEPGSFNRVALIQILAACGHRLFDSFDVGSQHSALCALNSLRLALEDEDAHCRIFKTLAQSRQFCLLIASARLWFYDEILALRPLFSERMLVLRVISSIPFPATLLQRAVCFDDLIEDLLFTRHEILPSVVSMLTFWDFAPHLSRFIQQETVYHVYVHVVSDFMARPTLLTAYLATNFLVRVANNSSESAFSKAEIEILFESLRATALQTDSVGSGIVRDCSFLLQTDFDSLERLFSALPAQIDPNHLVDLVFEYPAFSSQLGDYIMSEMAPDRMDTAVSIANQLLEVLPDFVLLLIRQSRFVPFLAHLLRFLGTIRSDAHFAPIWLLALTLVRECWGRGPESARRLLREFLEACEPPQLRMFLMHYLQMASDPAYPGPTERSLPLSQAISYPGQLHEPSPSKIARQVKTKPHLWPSVCIWWFENPVPTLMQLRPPDCRLLNFLHFHTLLKITEPIRQWQCAAEMPDIPMLTLFVPHSITEIDRQLAAHLRALTSERGISIDCLTDISVMWRAWTAVFGFDAFAAQLLGQVFSATVHVTMPRPILNLFQSVAYLMPMLVNSVPDNTAKLLQLAFDTLEESLEGIWPLTGLAEFCLIVVCTTLDEWEPTFAWFLGRCLHFLQEDKFIRRAQSVFGLAVLKRALYAPFLRDKVVEVAYDAIREINDCQMMIDFFIVKHSLQIGRGD
jgi:hypothetical protein